jgi:hypothetical protein
MDKPFTLGRCMVLLLFSLSVRKEAGPGRGRRDQASASRTLCKSNANCRGKATD